MEIRSASSFTAFTHAVRKISPASNKHGGGTGISFGPRADELRRCSHNYLVLVGIFKAE